MKWENGVLIYGEGELDSDGCAPDPKWAASQLRAYGVDVIMESKKLQPILLCSKVLELAEILFCVEPAAAAEPAAAGTGGACGGRGPGARHGVRPGRGRGY